MLPLLTRLLAVLALVLMPVTMTASPAFAAEHGQVATSMPCGDHDQPSKSSSDRPGHCTSCVAVAEPTFASLHAPMQLVALLADRDQRLMLGVLLEVATPPPRVV